MIDYDRGRREEEVEEEVIVHKVGPTCIRKETCRCAKISLKSINDRTVGKFGGGAKKPIIPMDVPTTTKTTNRGPCAK